MGKKLALTIYYEVGDIARFASAKQFCSYARVVPGMAQSGDVIRRGTKSNTRDPTSRMGVFFKVPADLRIWRATVFDHRRKEMAQTLPIRACGV